MSVEAVFGGCVICIFHYSRCRGDTFFFPGNEVKLVEEKISKKCFMRLLQLDGIPSRVQKCK